MNYREFVQRAEKGEILIGVEPTVAREFFMGTDHSLVQNEIGEPLFVERFLVQLAFWLSYIFLLAGIIASIFALKWFGALAIPTMLTASFVLQGQASMGRHTLAAPLFLLFVGILLAYLFRESGPFMVVWLLLLPLPYLSVSVCYKLAILFLRALSLRNEKAFNLLIDEGIFIKESNS